MFKLELGETGQYASRGNVCIFVQDPGPLLNILPPPLSDVFDEICVVLVGSKDTPITTSMLERTPLLIRRQRIIDALIWLKDNNPLYADLDVADIRRNAATYPEHGVPIPEEIIFRAPSSSEGASYTTQANDEALCDKSRLPMQTRTVIDAESVDSTFQQSKLDALQVLNESKSSYDKRRKAASELVRQHNQAFIKFPSGSRPQGTRNNPLLFGQLWPTLFPYGVGMMENQEIAKSGEAPFRSIALRTHVAHL
ncbi:hypothetical protein K438DRAFT_1598658, partial [Mycena galopus ATCC 62051]